MLFSWMQGINFAAFDTTRKKKNRPEWTLPTAPNKELLHCAKRMIKRINLNANWLWARSEKPKKKKIKNQTIDGRNEMKSMANKFILCGIYVRYIILVLSHSVDRIVTRIKSLFAPRISIHFVAISKWSKRIDRPKEKDTNKNCSFFFFSFYW